jgi:hypothetical protein
MITSQISVEQIEAQHIKETIKIHTYNLSTTIATIDVVANMAHQIIQEMCTDTTHEQYLELIWSSLLEAQVHSVTSQTTPGKKSFVKLPISTTGSSFKPLTFQIDTAATCNTISDNVLRSNLLDAKIVRSPYLLFRTETPNQYSTTGPS